MSCDIPKKSRIRELISRIKTLEKEISPEVNRRTKQLKNNKNWFSELCFCILTANYTAEGGIRIQNSVKDFSKLSKIQIEKLLRKLGHRFPKTRAGYIYLAKKHKNKLKSLKQMKNSLERREWLVKNIKGLGYKEASHFLRNIGFFDVAIIDRHILSILIEYKIIKPIKTITKKSYLEIENKLKILSKKTNLSLGKLDFYLWYMKTWKVLK